MFRGNGKMDIFLDNEDRRKFLTIMETKQQTAFYEVFGYCLMTNHVHLLLKTGKESIGQSMKRIGISYAHYFNKKYNRVGHVFQDRFRSEVIENERYLLAALRYIHNNPVKGGLVNDPSQYRWSSYSYFLKPTQADSSFVNTQFILKILSNDTWKSLQLFKEFSRGRDDNAFMDVEEEPSKAYSINSIKDAQDFIEQYLKGIGVGFKNLKRKEYKAIRDQLIIKLKEESNLSVREIGGLMGVSKNVVARK
ncbi:MAG: transposase [Clostridiales bacterium]|nr:transposase [Clostridiales bacterium]